jgi:hypothetical protein
VFHPPSSAAALGDRSASVIVDSNAFGIPASWTEQSVRRLVPLKH